MRASWVVAAAMMIFLLGASPLIAGLYNTAEPVVDPRAMNYSNFRSDWNKLRSIGNEQSQSEQRKRYVLVAQLAQSGRGLELSAEQRLNLSEYLMRLRRYQEAIRVLEPAVLRDRTNFLALANLATAYQLAGQEDRALGYLEQALSERVWPKKWANLTSEQQQKWLQFGLNVDDRFEWYREVEEYQLRLLRLRARETLTRVPGQSRVAEDVDALFDDRGNPPKPIRFVGESGKYEAGALAAAERAKLPRDAVRIVEQLLIWLPDDTRLYWLLGELLNAEGDCTAAKQILDDVANRGFGAKALFEHRRALAEFRPKSPPAPNPETKTVKTTDGPPAALSPAWQPLAVAFAAGVLVAMLASWQIHEIRRRMGKPVASGRST